MYREVSERVRQTLRGVRCLPEVARARCVLADSHLRVLLARALGNVFILLHPGI